MVGIGFHLCFDCLINPLGCFGHGHLRDTKRRLTRSAGATISNTPNAALGVVGQSLSRYCVPNLWRNEHLGSLWSVGCCYGSEAIQGSLDCLILLRRE